MKKILCSLVLLITLCLNVHGEEILNEKFDNVQNGGEYYLNLLTNVSVSSTSFDVEKTELYVDDSLYNESSENPAIFDLSEMPAGKKNLRAVCYDAAGNTGTSEVTIIAHEMCKSQVLSYNLDSMEGGQYPNYTEFESSKLSGSGEAGYFKIESFDEQMGNSAIVGMETKNASKSSGAWFGITGQSKSRVALYADIYIDTIGSYSFFLRGSTGSIYSTDIQFKKDGTLNFAGSGDNSLKSIPYEAKKWYSIEYYVDTVKKTYSFVMDGVPLALNYNISNQNMDTVNAIRFVGPNYDSIKTFGAIDNLRTVRFEPLPCVTGIAGESTMADSDNTYVDLSFSDSVDVSSIGVDDVEFSLPDEIDSILAVDGTTIRINLKNMLLSNNEYFIKINSGLKAVSIGSTVSLTAPQSVKFNTKPNDVEMTNERVEGTAFNCTLKNNTSAEKTVYLIESVFSANRIENVLCLPIVIGGNEESPVSYIAGQNSRIVILDGVTNAKAISEKTFVVK